MAIRVIRGRFEIQRLIRRHLNHSFPFESFVGRLPILRVGGTQRRELKEGDFGRKYRRAFGLRVVDCLRFCESVCATKELRRFAATDSPFFQGNSRWRIP